MNLLRKILNRNETPIPIYRFNNKGVWIVWLFPDGKEKAPQFYGAFSTEKRAYAGLLVYEQMNKPVESSVEMYIVDFRLLEKTVRYYKW